MQQESQLIENDFEVEEGITNAALLRDANSMSNPDEALLEGEYLKGIWLEVKLSSKKSSFVYLNSPYIDYDLSPRNM